MSKLLEVNNLATHFFTEEGIVRAVDGITYTVVDNDTLYGMDPDTDNFTEVCTSHVTDMNNLFDMEFSFNQDIGGWDTSRVTNMEEMFSRAFVFNQSLGWEP